MDCYCCDVRDRSMVARPTLHPDTPQPAVYLWTNRNGDQTALCVGCCAEWREFEAKAAVIIDDGTGHSLVAELWGAQSIIQIRRLERARA